MTRFVSVITPVSLCARSNACEAAVFIRDVENRKPELRCVPMARFRQLVRGLTLSKTGSSRAGEPPAEPLRLPAAGALQILKTGRLPTKLAAGPGEFVEPIPRWLTGEHHELRLYAAGLVAKRPKPSDVPALRSLIVRAGWGNDHAAKLGCEGLRKLGPKAIAAIPELLRAAAGFVSGGCPQRFAHAAPAILKIAPTSPPPELVKICVRHLKVSNPAIQKVAIETLTSVAPKLATARDALRRLDKLRDARVAGKAIDPLLRRARDLR
jgi:hypothetical protein